MHVEPRPLTLAHHVRAVELGSSLALRSRGLYLSQSGVVEKSDARRASVARELFGLGSTQLSVFLPAGGAKIRDVL